MTLEKRFSKDQIQYTNQSIWTLNDLQPGVYSTADTPAQGYIMKGSQGPGGRVMALHPDTISATTGTNKQVILPDVLGTTLLNDDGTDYSGIIGGSQVNGTFVFVGVSAVHNGEHDVCGMAERNYHAMRNGSFNQIPNEFVLPQKKPVGYEFEAGIDNYWDYESNISIIQNDYVAVYAESDINHGDTILVRVEVTDANAIVPQLFGGVTSIADAGTQDPSAWLRFRVEKPALAGSATVLQIL